MCDLLGVTEMKGLKLIVFYIAKRMKKKIISHTWEKITSRLGKKEKWIIEREAVKLPPSPNERKWKSCWEIALRERDVEKRSKFYNWRLAAIIHFSFSNRTGQEAHTSPKVFHIWTGWKVERWEKQGR
jgi:hypothetical protein